MTRMFICRTAALTIATLCVVAVSVFIAPASVAQLASSGGRTGPMSFAVRPSSAAQPSEVDAVPPTKPLKPTLVKNYARLPLVFEANQGQSDPQVKFISRGAGYNLFLTATEAVLQLSPDASPAQSSNGTLRMKLLNANPKTEVSGLEELPGKSNYFIGSDPRKWHTDVRQYAKVRYEKVYPGVDLVYYGRQRELEYDFVVHPGVDPGVIRLAIDGASKMRLERGTLLLTSSAGEVRLRRPQIYQRVNGTRRKIQGKYVFKSKSEVGFRVASYDRKRTLIIDPALGYSTYLGGNLGERSYGIAVDMAGNAYVTGRTTSTDFPTTNAVYPTSRGNHDIFVSKINGSGTALVFSTYLGGSADEGDWGGIAVDSMGNTYLTGSTASRDFPTLNAIQPTLAGQHAAFVTKINASGTALLYSTYLGGSNDSTEGALGIAVDPAGNAYVTGSTSSTDFPTAQAIQPTNHGAPEAYVTKINALGTTLVYSTYLGGSGHDHGYAIAVDKAGNTYLTGWTTSSDFPTANAIQPTNHGTENAFVTKINAAGTALAYSTYLGGSGGANGYAIAADVAGNAYVTGAAGPDFPTAYALQSTNRGGGDAFVTKINPSGAALVYSTYLGGSVSDLGMGMATDSAGNAYVSGLTWSTDFPTVNAVQSAIRGNQEAFLSKVAANGSTLVYSTYLGGSGSELAFHGIAVDTTGNAYMTGSSPSPNFPTTLGVVQPSLRGGSDAFVTKIVPNTFVRLFPLTLGFGKALLGVTNPQKRITLTNTGPSALTINKLYVAGANAGDFAETNACPAALAARATCDVWVTFTPTAKGPRKGALAISDSDPASPQSVSLTGTGTVVSLSPTALAFGKQPVGTTSAVRTAILTNTGSETLNFAGIAITGVNASDFSQTNNCGAGIGGGASCTITVTFKPTVTGTRSATVSISDDGGGSPQKIVLSGTGA